MIRLSRESVRVVEYVANWDAVMHEISPKILTDEHARPVAVQISYSEWLEIERLLASNGGAKKSGDLRGLAGSIRWGEDAVAYQRRVREEWRR